MRDIYKHTESNRFLEMINFDVRMLDTDERLVVVKDLFSGKVFAIPGEEFYFKGPNGPYKLIPKYDILTKIVTELG